MLHSFVDESKRDSYLLIAALIHPAHVARVRRDIASMVMGGQRRIHFHNERDARKSQIMNRLAELPLQVVIFEARGHRHEGVARAKCMTSLVNFVVARDVRRLVIETDESQVEADRRILRHELERADALDQLTYEHSRPHEEMLLAIPDAIGWCWPRGGHWRVKAKGLVTEVFQA